MDPFPEPIAEECCEFWKIRGWRLKVYKSEPSLIVCKLDIKTRIASYTFLVDILFKTRISS